MQTSPVSWLLVFAIADHMSMGALGDSYFEYLLKEWLRSGREDQESRQMYDEAMQAVMTHMLRTSSGGLMYFSDLKFDRLEHKMDHLACFSGTLHINLSNPLSVVPLGVTQQIVYLAGYLHYVVGYPEQDISLRLGC